MSEMAEVGLAGQPQTDPKLAKDAGGYQRFAEGPQFGERAFPDAEAGPGYSGGITGSIQELDRINADRERAGEEPRGAESYLSERRQNAAGMQAYNSYLGSLQEGQQPMSEQQYAAVRAGDIAGAKTTGTGMAQRQLDLPQAFSLHSQTTQNFARLTDAATTLKNNAAMWKAVGLYQSLAAIPGQEGADVRAQIQNIKSQVGFMVLQDMRNASKTGGALGQVS